MNGLHINKGPTPLGYAVQSGCIDAVKLLIEHGANVTDRLSDNDHRNLLDIAAKQGNVDIAALLIEKGLNVSDTCDDGQKVPLDFAASAGIVDMARLLLDKGANLNATDKDGQTPLHLACRARECRDDTVFDR